MSTDLLKKGIKINHLRFIAHLAEQGSITGAANALGISQPAASRLAAEITDLTGAAIYQRNGRSIDLTESGRMLANRAARIMNEIKDAGREISELQQGLTGHVRIGSVTGPSIDYVLPAVRKARLSYPGISVHVEIAASDLLVPMLAGGRLDFALCRQPDARFSDTFEERTLAREPVSFVARRGHPLLRTQGPCRFADMVGHDWVMPPEGAILRTTVERVLRDLGTQPPANVFTTSSFLFTLAMLCQTNAIAPVASAVAASFASAPTDRLAILQTEIPVAVETYSMLTLRAKTLTPAAMILYGDVMSTHSAALAAA